MSSNRKPKPRYTHFSAIASDYRRGTGALPIVLSVFSVLAFLIAASELFLFTKVSNAISYCIYGVLLLSVAAVVKSIRSIEAYTIYMARLHKWTAENAYPSADDDADPVDAYRDSIAIRTKPIKTTGTTETLN